MIIDGDFDRKKVKTQLEAYPMVDRPLLVITAKHNSGTGSTQKITVMLSPHEAEVLRKQLDSFLAQF